MMETLATRNISWGRIEKDEGKKCFLFDFDSCDEKEQFDILCETQEMLQGFGWEIDDPCLEHDRLTGYLVEYDGVN